MRPKRIILVRHGESQGNADKKIYLNIPDYALELTERGIFQANEAGKKLKELIGNESVFFYISPFHRARMTFESIATYFTMEQFKHREDPRLREQDWGHLRNLEDNLSNEKYRDSYGTFYFRIPDGESAADAYDRVSDFLSTLHRDFEKEDFPENVVIVNHGMTARLFLMRWFHWTVEEFESLANPKNCQIIVMNKIENSSKYSLDSKLETREVGHNFQRPLSLTRS